MAVVGQEPQTKERPALGTVSRRHVGVEREGGKDVRRTLYAGLKVD